MKTYRITYETTASVTAYVQVPDDVEEIEVDEYVSDKAHDVVETHLQTLGAHLGDITITVDASIDGDGGGDIVEVEGPGSPDLVDLVVGQEG